MSEKGFTKKRIAVRALARIQTGAFKAAFKSAAEMCYVLFVRKRMLANARRVDGAREARRRKQRKGGNLAQVEALVASDVVAHLRLAADSAAQPAANDAPPPKVKLVQTSQVDEYKQRGKHDDLRWRGIFHYSVSATRVAQPRNGRARPAPLNHPFFPFAKHYSDWALRRQRLDTKRDGPRAPPIEAFTMPTEAKGPGTNALYKSAIFRPLSCSRSQSNSPMCNKLRPFGGICDRDGRARPWGIWLTRQKIRAEKAGRLRDSVQMRPSFQLFRTALTEDVS